MHRMVVFGNSGSGKSSLARRLSNEASLAHLDLDDIAWKQADPPVREDFDTSKAKIDQFIDQYREWVIEGCYSSLIKLATEHASQMLFLNIGVEQCIKNCRSRPWEPHKYASQEEQNRNLYMLVDWVKSYESRDDEFSSQKHRRIFDNFVGIKTEIMTNEQAALFHL